MKEHIYFKDGNRAANLTELITIGYKGYYKFQPTYKDKDCTIKQCDYARRSFYDLLAIAQTYFPCTTKQELAFTLLNKVPKMGAFYCADIRRIVFINDWIKRRYFIEQMHPDYNADYLDDSGLTFNIIKDLAEEYCEHIYFKEAEGCTTVADVLEKGFTNVGFGEMFFNATYKDPECTVPQCRKARRSFDELYTICKTYVPTATRAELAKHLMDYLSFVCRDIDKVVFLKERHEKGFHADSSSTDEYDANYVDSTGICYNDIKALV